MKLGKIIRLCRIQREWTQEELASGAGLSYSYLSLLERDKRDPRFSTIQKIAKALSIPLSVLIFLADSDEHRGMNTELLGKQALQALRFFRGNKAEEET